VTAVQTQVLHKTRKCSFARESIVALGPPLSSALLSKRKGQTFLYKEGGLPLISNHQTKRA